MVHGSRFQQQHHLQREHQHVDIDTHIDTGANARCTVNIENIKMHLDIDVITTAGTLKTGKHVPIELFPLPHTRLRRTTVHKWHSNAPAVPIAASRIDKYTPRSDDWLSNALGLWFWEPSVAAKRFTQGAPTYVTHAPTLRTNQLLPHDTPPAG